MYRRVVLRSARPFSTSQFARKSAVDSIKDAAHKVNRTVSDKLAAGIEAGEQIAGKTQQATRVTGVEAKEQARSTVAAAADKAKDTAEAAKKKL